MAALKFAEAYIFGFIQPKTLILVSNHRFLRFQLGQGKFLADKVETLIKYNRRTIFYGNRLHLTEYFTS